MTHSASDHGRTEDGFDPVILNLSNDDAYYVLMDALEEFVSRAEGEIADELQEGLDASSRWSNRDRLQGHVDLAKKMVEDIDRQIDANGEALSGSADS